MNAISRLGVLSLVVVFGCSSKKGDPAPIADRGAPATASAMGSASASSSASIATQQAVPDNTIPVLHADRLRSADGTAPEDMFQVEGAIMVKAGKRVGRIHDGGVEFLSKEVPPGNPALGDHIVQSVVGRWPDEIGVLYTNANGRALEPTYYPMTGKGMSYTAGAGGMMAHLGGVARIDDAWVLSTYDMMNGSAILPVRGKILRKRTAATDAGCKDSEIHNGVSDKPAAAITFDVLQSTPAGTLISIGDLCERKVPVAEVWAKDSSTSKIVELPKSWAGYSFGVQSFKGARDELYLFLDPWKPILRYHDGAFEEVPSLGRMVELIFTTPNGELHAYDGKTIHRFDGTSWSPVAAFESEESYRTLAIEDGVIWASTGAAVYRGKEQSRVEYEKKCSTPFVSLFAEDPTDPPGYNYPHTREKLAGFPELADLEMVEFFYDHHQYIGVKVKSAEQGDAVVKYAHEKMTDDDPHYVCYAPKVLRTIDMKTGK